VTIPGSDLLQTGGSCAKPCGDLMRTCGREKLAVVPRSPSSHEMCLEIVSCNSPHTNNLDIIVTTHVLYTAGQELILL
jgi:hypothetical protein